MSSRRKLSGMRYAGLGMEFAAAVAGLTLLGHWADRHFGSEPWGLLIGAALGIVGGMYNMIREALGSTREESRSRGDDSGGEA